MMNTILTIIFLINSVNNSRMAEGHSKAIYSRVGVITEIDEKNDSVTFTDSAGLKWTSTGIEDYYVGDMVAAIMADVNDTPETILDDEIIQVEYVGWAERYMQIENSIDNYSGIIYNSNGEIIEMVD